MNQPMQSANPSAIGDAAIPQQILEGGEIVILALRPSGWFVILESMSVLLPAAVIAAIIGVAGYLGVIQPDSPRIQMLWTVLITIAWLRLVVACVQWAGRLYVLTNHRVMTIRGVFQVEISQSHFASLASAELSVTGGQKMFSVGTIVFSAKNHAHTPAPWRDIPKPQIVLKMVRQAMEKR